MAAKSATTKSSSAKSASTKSVPAKSVSAKSESASRRPTAREILRLILASLDDIKAEDSVTIDLTDKSTIGDYMVVTTGRSQRHVGAVADNVCKAMSKAGIKGVRVEGMPQCDWVLIDVGDVIVHVFHPEARDFYNIEKMWAPGRSGRRAG